LVVRFPEERHCLIAIYGRIDFIRFARKAFGQPHANIGLIVNNQDAKSGSGCVHELSLTGSNGK
jgi:hypothetical protein